MGPPPVRWRWLGSMPPRDAFVVATAAQAGAVILGKTNLSEWANFRSSHSTSGWSGRGGLTRNLTLWTATPPAQFRLGGGRRGEPVRGRGRHRNGWFDLSPASVNGIVGIKPTVGLVSRSGIIPISHTQDTAGPMARTVTDAAILLGVLAGADPRDPRRRSRAGKVHPITRGSWIRMGCGARASAWRESFSAFTPRSIKLMEEALAAMKRCGAVLIDPATLPSHGKLAKPEIEVLLYELKAGTECLPGQLGPGRAGAHAQGHHRFQRAQPRSGDAVVRPGDVAQSRSQRAADRTGVSRCAGELPPPARTKGSTR